MAEMQRSKHYLELDGLRGLAALSVVLFHQRHWFGGDFFSHAYLAVDFFFMLSGFVIAHAYGERLKASGSFGSFVRDRLIRLHPMLIFGAVLGGAVIAVSPRTVAELGPDILALDTIAAAFPFPSFWEGELFRINPPSWSLFWELLANFGFALLVPYLTTRRLILLVIVFAITMLFVSASFGGFVVGWKPDSLLLGGPRVSVGFLIGVLLHRFHLAGFMADGGKRYWIAPLLAVSFILVPPYAPAAAVYDPVIVLGLYPLLVLAAAGSAPIIPRVAILSGAISYPLYILHAPLLQFLSAVHKKLVGSEVGATTGAVLVIAVVAASYLVLKCYDEPVRCYLRRKFGSAGHRKPPEESS